MVSAVQIEQYTRIVTSVMLATLLGATALMLGGAAWALAFMAIGAYGGQKLGQHSIDLDYLDEHYGIERSLETAELIVDDPEPVLAPVVEKGMHAEVERKIEKRKKQQSHLATLEAARLLEKFVKEDVKKR